MITQRISIKLFVQEPAALDLTAVAPLFHRWIQRDAVPGLLIDVADYRHVPAGPGVLLIGHEGDYALDLGGGRPGFLYRQKRAWPQPAATPVEGVVAARLRHVLGHAVSAAQTLAADPVWQGRLAFRNDEVEVGFQDRLRTPNTPETWVFLEQEVGQFFTDLFPDTSFHAARVSDDPRRPFSLQLQAPEAPSLDFWPARLAQLTQQPDARALEPGGA